MHCEAREPLVITEADLSAEQRGDTTGRCHLSVVTCSLSGWPGKLASFWWSRYVCLLLPALVLGEGVRLRHLLPLLRIVRGFPQSLQINSKTSTGIAELSHTMKVDNSSIERVEEFKYLGTTITNQNSIQKEIKSRLKLGNACYHSVQNLLSSSLLYKI